MSLKVSVSRQLINFTSGTYWSRYRLLRLALVVFVFTFATAVVGKRVWLKSNTVLNTATPFPLARLSVVQPIQGNSQRTASALPIQLKPGGFVPGEVTLPKGQYYFSVQDISGQSDTVLQLQREQGNSIREVRLNKRKRVWRELVHLTPGDYVLIDANHPQLACRISIIAQ